MIAALAASLALVALPVQPAPAMTVAASWALDETGGHWLAYDSTPNPVHGVVDPDVVRHGPGLGYRFDWPPSRIVIFPHAPKLDPGPGDFAVHLRMSFDNNGDANVMQKGTSNSPGGWKVEAKMAHGGYARCTMWGTAGRLAVNSDPAVVPIRGNGWHWVSCIRRGDSLTVMVDGRSWTRRGPLGDIANRRDMFLGGKWQPTKPEPYVVDDALSGFVEAVHIERASS